MSNEKKTEEKNEKAMTKYERKLEKRQAEAEADKKSWKRFKIGFGIAVAAVAAIILVSVGISAYNDYAALNKAYITVGDHEITEVEFNFYFYNAVNSHLDTYGEYGSLFGFDTSIPLSQQPFSTDMTWEDFFDENAVHEIVRVKSMVDDAKANGFTYDDTDDIENLESEIASMAESEGVTTTNYYVLAYGENATADRIRPFFKENMLASAYHTYLVQQNQPTDEEIEAYYAEDKMLYDLVDCRNFYVKADVTDESTEDEIAAAMKEAKAIAEKFADRREKGEEFEALCAEYAPEDEKENYGGESDGSLIEDGIFYEVPAIAMNWLYEDDRTAGEVTVIEDSKNNRYCIVEYLDRTNDWESTRAEIANSLGEERAKEYEDTLDDKYEVKEGRGKLVYLTLPEPETQTEAE